MRVNEHAQSRTSGIGRSPAFRLTFPSLVVPVEVNLESCQNTDDYGHNQGSNIDVIVGGEQGSNICRIVRG